MTFSCQDCKKMVIALKIAEKALYRQCIKMEVLGDTHARELLSYDLSVIREVIEKEEKDLYDQSNRRPRK